MVSDSDDDRTLSSLKLKNFVPANTDSKRWIPIGQAINQKQVFIIFKLNLK